MVVSLSTIDVVAIHDARLARMQFEAALSEAFVNPLQNELRLRLALAVNGRIVGVLPPFSFLTII